MDDIKWTAKLAYIVGLLVTDGCLSSDGRHIIFRSSDIQLIQTFSECLHLNNKIGSSSYQSGFEKKLSYRVQLGNVKLYRWLLRQGLFPAKTYTIGKINVPDKYFRDFLRGHLDGDGTIFTYLDEHNHYKGRIYTNQRVFTRFISASQVHILWLHKKIKELAGVKGACLSRLTKSGLRMWEIKYAKKESAKLLQWIYYQDNLPCLERKRVKALQAIVDINKEKRRKYEKLTF